MKIGTKSLLFGGHQFLIHPVLVYCAWVKVYGSLPSFWETIAIGIHDWGYWGKPNIDGPEGEDHPRWAADFLLVITGQERLWEFCNFHSRFQAKHWNAEPSRLCIADKMGIVFLPSWLWLFLCRLSGELYEYQTARKDQDEADLKIKDPAEWFRRYRKTVLQWAKDGNFNATVNVAGGR